MATNLARQLQRLEDPGQPSFQKLAGKKRDSFLFEAREAGDVDTDTIFNLAMNGLEELVTMDEVFTQFRDSLFSESFKDFERTHLTEDDVEKLNNDLERFLQLLSPYFLLRPTHKCLEWLIRVFRIHTFNVDHVMQCILPYHQTNLFVRMVQLLHLKKSSSPWHWLRPLQKSGVPLAQQTLINHCVSDRSCLTFVCELVGKSVQCHHHRPACSQSVVALYTSTVVGVTTEGGKNLSEDLVTLLSPHLLRGLRSRNGDLYCSSLVLLSLLCSRALLVDRLVHSFLDALTKNLKPEFEQESFLCLSLVCVSQKQLSLTKRSTRHLIKHSRLLAGLLATVDSSHNVQLFSEVAMRSLVEAVQRDSPDGATCSKLLIEMVGEFPLRDSFVEELTSSVLSLHLDSGKEKSRKCSQPSAALLKTLSTRYADEFDKAVSAFLSKEDTEERRAAVFLLVSSTLPGVQHQLVQGTSHTLSLGLHHHDDWMRKAAVVHLKSLIETGQLGEEGGFVGGACLQRLQDDSRDVVEAVLSIPERFLFTRTTPIELMQGLMRIIRELKWEDLVVQCVHIASSEAAVDSVDAAAVNAFVLELLAHSLAAQKRWKTSLAILSVLESSQLARVNPLLRNLGRVCSSEEYRKLRSGDLSLPERADVSVRVNLSIVQWTAENLAELSSSTELIQQLVAAVRAPLTKRSVRCFVFGHFVLYHLMRLTPDPSLQVDLAAVLLSSFSPSSLEAPSAAYEGSMAVPEMMCFVLSHLSRSTKSSNLRSLYSSIHLLTMNVVIETVVRPPPTSSVWLTMEGPQSPDHLYHFTLLYLLDVLAASCARGDGDSGKGGESVEVDCRSNVHRSLLQRMMEVQFPGRGWLLRFLALVWTSPHLATIAVESSLVESLTFTITPTLQARGLLIGASYLSSVDVQALVAICTTSCPLIPSLLVPLASPAPALRQRALHYFRAIHEAVQELTPGQASEAHASSPLLHLVAAVAQHSFDIASDPQYIAVVLKELFGGAVGINRGGSRSHDKGGLSSLQAHFMTAIVQQGMPTAVQTKLLGNLRLVDHPVKLRETCQLLSQVLSEPNLSPAKKTLLETIIKGFTPGTAAVFTECQSSFQTFLKVLFSHHDNFSSVLQEQAVKQVTQPFFLALDSHLQALLLKAMLDALLWVEQDTMATAIRSALQKLPLTADHLSEELKRDFLLLGVAGSEDQPTPKRRRRQTPVADLARARLRLAAVLELSTSLAGPGTEDHWRLVPLLFQILDHILESDQQWAEFDYVVQLALTHLTTCCRQLNAMAPAQALKVVPEDSFDMEVVVKCIRLSVDTHTHHHALLLLAAAAQLYPTKVLHNTMPVFTFMGDTVVRKDNSYSFAVIQQTIDCIVPALLQSPSLQLQRDQKPSSRATKKQQPSLEAAIEEVLQVFVDALPHVPPHRRQPLFIHLLRAVGAGHFLHLLWTLLAHKHVLGKNKEGKQINFPYVHFACEMADHFPGDSLSAILKVLQYTSSLPFEKPKRQLRHPGAGLTFDPSRHSTKQLLYYQHSLYGLMSLLLGRPAVVGSITESPDSEDLVLRLLEKLLVVMATQSQASLKDSDSQRFLSSVQQKTSEVTEKVTNLLSLESFISVAKQLIEGSSQLPQLKAFELLVNELKSPREELAASHKDQLVSIVDRIQPVAMVKSKRQTSPSANQIAALRCLQSLGQHLTRDHPAVFADLVPHLLGTVAHKGTPPEVVSVSLLVVSSLVARIGVRLIPMLSRLVPTVLDHLSPTAGSGPAAGSASSALLNIVKTLANFISPYLEAVMAKVCASALSSGQVDPQLSAALKNIRLQLGSCTPQLVLLPALVAAFKNAKGWDKEEATNYLQIAEECLSKMATSDVRLHSKTILDLSQLLLSYRTHHPSVEDLDAVAAVEEGAVTAVGGLVLRMTEATFRPLFLKLFDWATQESVAKEPLIAFYHFTCKMADILKGIFLLFAGHMLLNCAELLPLLHSENDVKVFSEDKKNSLLLSFILQTLCKCFVFGKKQFLSKERFNALVTPLVSQVSSSLGGGEESLRRRSQDLAPCLAEFGGALSGQDLSTKRLNQKLLLLTRHDQSQVRLDVLVVLGHLYRKLGEEFVFLLPETIPYLAELLEDECEEVEKECRKLIAEVEKIVGEPIQEHLTAQ